MPAPTIRYAHAKDGGRVAFHTLGTGPALVMLFPLHVSHLTLNWQVPLHRTGIEFFARHFQVINLDCRGGGLSERRIACLSVDSLVADVDVVLAALGVERVAFCALGDAALLACHFAAIAPTRVASIVFVQSGESAANRRLLSLRHITPNVEAQVRGALFGGLGDKHNSAALASVARDALDPEALRQWEQLLEITSLLLIARQVAAPALCLHASDDELISRAAAQDFADHLQLATFMPIAVRSGMDIWRHRAILHATAQFIASGFNLPIDVLGRHTGKRAGRAPSPAGLSHREMEVLRLLARGLSNQQIAESLFVSINTVSSHLRHIFANTSVCNRTEAAAFAFDQGIL